MLEISDLCVAIGPHRILSVEKFQIDPGQRVGLVGESGSGKTMMATSIAGLLPDEASVQGSIRLDGSELIGRSDRERAKVRGSEIGMIFQDPLKALNPLMRIGRQVAEAVRIRSSLTRREAGRRVLELLEQVQLPEPAQLARRYPHQLSGGQRQRAMIAMAIARNPRLLIADEPTTALDVTVQQGILELLLDLSRQHGMALLFITHDLGVVRAVSDRIAVMYGGRLVESGPVREVIHHPRHRYTEALIAASPASTRLTEASALLGVPFQTIAGTVPAAGEFPSGCRFRNRCTHAVEACAVEPAATEAGDDHLYRCWNPAIRTGAEAHELHR
ncbi:ABC transporter ATP-binding protein [Kribbella hippodromi]|uniref:ABC transporter ATP-binding protein n=1 Tax=Kribbella hippodromi TaxID=434347 RepID=A0ABN2CR14_9ACTN